MKICYIIDAGLNNGGAPISTYILACEMVKNGNEVHIIMPNDEATKAMRLNDGIIYHEIKCFKEYFPFEILHPLKFYRLIKIINSILKKISADILHAQMPRGGKAISLLRKFNKISKEVKLVYTDREYVIDLRKIYKKIYGYTIGSNYDYIICLTKTAANYWKKYPVKNHITVIPNAGGVVFDLYDKLAIQEAKKKFPELNNGKINIIFVGRMTWEKRWGLAKDVIRELVKKHGEKINIILAIACKSTEMKEKTEQYLSDFKNSKRIFIFINQDLDTLSSLYYLSDIHIITSCRESFGRTAIEAMSRKTVVISTEAGAIRETIGRDDNIVDDDVESIVNKVDEFIENPKKLYLEKDFFYKRYNDVYTTKANTKMHLQLYSKLLINGKG